MQLTRSFCSPKLLQPSQFGAVRFAQSGALRQHLESIRLTHAMRTQITVYLNLKIKNWLREYAARLHLKESEVVRQLIVRESHIHWLETALRQQDTEPEK